MKTLLKIAAFALLGVVLFVLWVALSSGKDGDGGLVGNAKMKNVATGLTKVHEALLQYKNLYQALPGDDPKASSRWPDVKDGNGDGKLLGSFNATSPDQESALLWVHLVRAGLIENSYQTNANGGTVGVQVLTSGAIAVCSADMSKATVQAIDSKLDDGAPGSGSVLAYPQATKHLSAGDTQPLLTTPPSYEQLVDGTYVTVCATKALTASN